MEYGVGGWATMVMTALALEFELGWAALPELGCRYHIDRRQIPDLL
jgi:hypothetical protein